MNKRIEKKRRTQMMLDRILRIVELMSQATDDNFAILEKRLEKAEKRNEELMEIILVNVKEVNNRFDELEICQKIVEDDVAELKKAKKKGWFSRK
ncbi:Uncharacterised protein [Streptococcus equi subsp. equi]|uniref:hypothetical protein n=3 Tax=Streptococcus equi TaxID=1336 RepID=UPI00065A5886|nr:hypothetical protein [Streptococcus equi]ASB95819.1 hypothetical protein SE071780_00200 [Streptococcus equi subsp. equi]ASB96449.1 hypothetical protein SE071780_00843 [Streptococcus equi subsp. equi]MBT1197823.1 hypothetical protein [Streptococcus equi subsp. equi]MBT1198160.1 hypothetical protein [Streptococcus equi subsp. equi]MBT1198756.1 hypothetical protein [Streptococcus equi subsp. equi]